MLKVFAPKRIIIKMTWRHTWGNGHFAGVSEADAWGVGATLGVAVCTAVMDVEGCGVAADT